MQGRFRGSGDESQEWSEADHVLGYRICAYNEEHKQAPIHVHDRFNAIVGTLPMMTKFQANRLVRRFARDHEWFDMEWLARLAQEEVTNGDYDREPPDRT